MPAESRSLALLVMTILAAFSPMRCKTEHKSAAPRNDLNDYLLSVLLGIIEGLTEFLPVSSTAHLRISEAFLGVDLGNGYWKMFSIVIQLGAILCLPIYFWPRIVEFMRDFPQGKRGDRTVLTHPLSLTIIAFVCTAIPALLNGGGANAGLASDRPSHSLASSYWRATRRPNRLSPLSERQQDREPSLPPVSGERLSLLTMARAMAGA